MLEVVLLVPAFYLGLYLENFLLSAEQGNMLSQYALGLLYYKGDGVVKNYLTAMEYFKDAAFQGHPSSLVNIGNFYYLGYGVIKDLSRAHMWWSLAKDKGLDGAFENIIKVESLMTDNELNKAIILFQECQKKTLPFC